MWLRLAEEGRKKEGWSREKSSICELAIEGGSKDCRWKDCGLEEEWISPI